MDLKKENCLDFYNTSIDYPPMKKTKREFNVVIEKDEDGFFVADIPNLPGCHTQAKSLDQLMKRVHEAVSLYLEACKKTPKTSEFIGVQRIFV